MTEMVAPTEGGERKLYARKSSGLIRTIGVFGAMVFGVHCISLSSSGLIPYSWVAGVWPGSSIIGVLSVAAIFCLFHAYTYANIGATMPRSAADYTLASRVLSPPLAFAASWTLVIFSAMVAGALIAWIPSGVVPTFMQSMGIVFQNDGMLRVAEWSASSTGIIVIGTICTIITFLTMILSTRTIVRILEIGFFLGLIAWAIIYFQLLFPVESFPAAWDRFMGVGSYASRIELAQQNGMVLNPNVALMTLAGLIMGFWIFYGYYIPTFFAGEVKQADKTLLAGSWASLIVTWAIFVLGAILIQRLVPLDWIAAESYLSQSDYAASNLTMPWITFWAAILRPSFPLVLLVFIAWVYTLINLAQTYFFYCSRIVFAWSFDRLIPESVCWIHPKLHSPIVAITIITVIAEVGVIDAALGGVMGAQLNFVFFAVCTQLIPVLAMTLFPYLKPDLYENSSALVRRKLGGVPLITIVGGITMAYLVWMIIASFAFPAVGGRIGLGTLGTLAAFFISGIVVFYAARSYRMSREGIDIGWTFQSVPPV